MKNNNKRCGAMRSVKLMCEFLALAVCNGLFERVRSKIAEKRLSFSFFFKGLCDSRKIQHLTCEFHVNFTWKTDIAIITSRFVPYGIEKLNFPIEQRFYHLRIISKVFETFTLRLPILVSEFLRSFPWLSTELNGNF